MYIEYVMSVSKTALNAGVAKIKDVAVKKNVYSLVREARPECNYFYII